MPNDSDQSLYVDAKLEIEKQYNAFLANPHDQHGQIELFTAITSQMTEAKYGTELTSAQTHAMRRFIDMCHTAIKDDVKLYEKHNLRFERLLFSKQAWRVLAGAQEEYLLAAFIIALQHKDGNFQSNYGAVEALRSMSNHDFKGFPDNYKYVFGAELFGVPWAALYVDELTDNFQENYRVIASSTPVFVCRVPVPNFDDSQETPLPNDL